MPQQHAVKQTPQPLQILAHDLQHESLHKQPKIPHVRKLKHLNSIEQHSHFGILHEHRQLNKNIQGAHKLNLHPQHFKFKQSHHVSCSKIYPFLLLAM